MTPPFNKLFALRLFIVSLLKKIKVNILPNICLTMVNGERSVKNSLKWQMIIENSSIPWFARGPDLTTPSHGTARSPSATSVIS